MGKSLNLTVVAEGVETQEQETFLRDHECDETQGYYFSKPVASGEFAELLRRNVDSSRSWKPARGDAVDHTIATPTRRLQSI
jgi:sensor c-di-GMP phosphodiesterase-like protein